MNAAFVAARAVHFGATMLLFGELVFASFVAAGAAERGERATLDRHLRTVTGWALVASVLSGIGWLVIEATNMAGTPIGPGFGATLAIVLGQTEFGHVVAGRAILIVAIAVSLVSLARAKTDAATRRRTAAALAFAALYLATLAGEGHAAAATGTVGIAHIGADAFHLLAAGGWLGALPPLVYCFGAWPSHIALARLARRFSVLGVVCVGVLIASGIVNTLFLVGSFAALFGTPYGRVLIVKLAVFAAMLAIAATNRWRLTPQLTSDDAAARSLRRNATLEIAGGVVIVAIVGALGTMIPGAHQSPVWPFTFALRLSLVDLTGTARFALVAIAGFAFAALILIIAGVRRRFAQLWIPGSIVMLLCAAVSGWVLAVPALPTTFAMSAVPYTVDAIAHGAAGYAQHCSVCHGLDARGNGPYAASLPIKPVDLAQHALHHPQGDLFWRIAHGIPDTPMPAFSPALSDTDIWGLVQYLVARASAQAATSLGPHPHANSMSMAPDFTYERPGQGQRTLSGQRTPALIVIYSLPQSRTRLDEIASDHRVLHANLRVVAIPFAGSERAGDTNALIKTRVDPEVAAVYAMFAQTADGTRLSHVELLVDAAGVLRARWIGLPAHDSDWDAEILAAAKELPERPTMPAMMHHGH